MTGVQTCALPIYLEKMEKTGILSNFVRYVNSYKLSGEKSMIIILEAIKEYQTEKLQTDSK